LAEKQSDALLTTLNTLQSQVLGARSDTLEEASLRTQEAKLILQFIERAKQIKPKGQVILGSDQDFGDVLLENGDTIVIPSISKLVRVNGEVLFPNAVIFDKKYSPKDYIRLAGGFSQSAKKSRIILKKANGAVREIDSKRGRLNKGDYQVVAGDEILVLPNVDSKSFQHAKDVFQIVYQLALSAGVVLSI
jgi:protein involved in polysaccharide export with SLBB domain